MSELAPFHVFNFVVEFVEDSLNPGASSNPVVLCRGAFSECTGLEATMEPKVINEGGRNYGALQRSGRVTFGTVVLKRGVTSNRDLWKWFELVTSGGGYAHRLTAKVTMYGPAVPADSKQKRAERRWQLSRCLPTKFKAPDLNGQGAEVGIEELHLAHEGLSLEKQGS